MKSDWPMSFFGLRNPYIFIVVSLFFSESINSRTAMVNDELMIRRYVHIYYEMAIQCNFG